MHGDAGWPGHSLSVCIWVIFSCHVTFTRYILSFECHAKSASFRVTAHLPCLVLIYVVQSTLVISNSKRLSEILRDIRTSTYQICRIDEKLIRLTTFNKYICNWTLEVRDILKILRKRGENCSLGTRFSLRDKRLFDISEFEIARVNCIIQNSFIINIFQRK